VDFGNTPVEDLRDALDRNQRLLEAVQSPVVDILREQVEARRSQAISTLVYKDDLATIHFLRGALHILDEFAKMIDPEVIEHSNDELLAQIASMKDNP
jgi:hypothetical protein